MVSVVHTIWLLKGFGSRYRALIVVNRTKTTVSVVHTINMYKGTWPMDIDGIYMTSNLAIRLRPMCGVTDCVFGDCMFGLLGPFIRAPGEVTLLRDLHHGCS
jgi:hypothetical protein